MDISVTGPVVLQSGQKAPSAQFPSLGPAFQPEPSSEDKANIYGLKSWELSKCTSEHIIELVIATNHYPINN